MGMQGEYGQDEYDRREYHHGTSATHHRKKPGMVKTVFYSLGYLLLLIKRALVDDLALMWEEFRLLLGTVLVVVGTLSFESGRYCDGTPSTFAACTRPSTYYYYDPWVVWMIVAGVVLVLLWWLHKRNEER